MEKLRYTLIFHPEPEGGFTVAVPALPGCVTYRKNLGEAKEVAADAIGGYLASMEKDGETIPLRIKLGIDATSPDLHIGHAVRGN